MHFKRERWQTTQEMCTIGPVSGPFAYQVMPDGRSLEILQRGNRRRANKRTREEKPRAFVDQGGKACKPTRGFSRVLRVRNGSAGSNLAAHRAMSRMREPLGASSGSRQPKKGYRQSLGGLKFSLIERGLTQRSRFSALPALSFVPEALEPPNGCIPTTAPVGLSLR